MPFVETKAELSIRIGHAAGTLRDLVPVSVAIAKAHPLVADDPAHEGLALACLQLFRELTPAIAGRGRRRGRRRLRGGPRFWRRLSGRRRRGGRLGRRQRLRRGRCLGGWRLGFGLRWDASRRLRAIGFGGRRILGFGLRGFRVDGFGRLDRRRRNSGRRCGRCRWCGRRRRRLRTRQRVTHVGRTSEDLVADDACHREQKQRADQDVDEPGLARLDIVCGNARCGVGGPDGRRRRGSRRDALRHRRGRARCGRPGGCRGHRGPRGRRRGRGQRGTRHGRRERSVCQRRSAMDAETRSGLVFLAADRAVHRYPVPPAVVSLA